MWRSFSQKIFPPVNHVKKHPFYTCEGKQKKSESEAGVLSSQVFNWAINALRRVNRNQSRVEPNTARRNKGKASAYLKF